MWVVKVDKNGTLLWQKTLGSPNEETGTGVCIASNDGYIISGYTYPGSIGGNDCWLFVLDSSGGELNNIVFGGRDDDELYSTVPCSNGYAAAGYNGSSVFVDGSCNVNYSGAFVSYIDPGILLANNLKNSKPQLYIYPNPTRDEIYIAISGSQRGKLMVANSVEQILYRKEIRSLTDHLEIDTREWAKGIYLIMWQSEDGQVLTTKLIKN